MQIGSGSVKSTDKNVPPNAKGIRGSHTEQSGGSSPPPAEDFLLQPDGTSKFLAPDGVSFIKVP